MESYVLFHPSRSCKNKCIMKYNGAIFIFHEIIATVSTLAGFTFPLQDRIAQICSTTIKLNFSSIKQTHRLFKLLNINKYFFVD